MKKSIYTYLLCAGLILSAIGLLAHSGDASRAAGDALSLCGAVIIPALFPFISLSCFIQNSGASAVLGKPLAPLMRGLFKLPPELGSVVLMSFVGGYPVGAKLISDCLRQGRINAKTASRMICFCCNAGPSFLISAVGAGMMNSRPAGILLLIAHMAGSLIIGAAVSFRQEMPPARQSSSKAQGMAAAFVDSVTSASGAVLTMCAFIVLFSVIGALLQAAGAISLLADGLSAISGVFGIGDAPWAALLNGILEVTSGCVSAMQTPGSYPVILIAFFVSFAGFSVIFQVFSMFSGLDVNLKPFLITRIFHGVISSVIFLVLAKLFIKVLPATYPPQPYLHPNAPFLTICLVAMCCALILSVRASQKLPAKK